MKGIAAGVAAKFVSRNNDVNGYWALGVLYRSATRADSSEISIDLVSGESSPATKYSARLADPLSTFIYDQLRKLDFAEEQLTNAKVSLSFGVRPTSAQMRDKRTWGDPFTCQVALTDDLGRSWTYLERGWCGQHDPAREHRSNRVKTWWRSMLE